MSESAIARKTYVSPTLNKLTPEQAMLVLTGHASQGDLGARELLGILFPDSHEGETVRTIFDCDAVRLDTRVDSGIRRPILRIVEFWGGLKARFHLCFRG